MGVRLDVMDKLIVFKNRLEKIGINVTFISNVPWIYIDTIYDKKVTERFRGNHGFTVGFLPASIGGQFQFTDIGEIFKLIRKYKNKKASEILTEMVERDVSYAKDL